MPSASMTIGGDCTFGEEDEGFMSRGVRGIVPGFAGVGMSDLPSRVDDDLDDVSSSDCYNYLD